MPKCPAQPRVMCYIWKIIFSITLFMKTWFLVVAFAGLALGVNAQNVGVGTSNPNARLEVEGAGNTSGTTALDVKNSDGNSMLTVQDDMRTGINTSTPDSSSVLDVSSTTGGVLIPRMTAVQYQAISNPATGLLIFNTDDNKFYYYDGTQWVTMVSVIGGGGGQGGDPTLVYTVDGF